MVQIIRTQPARDKRGDVVAAAFGALDRHLEGRLADVVVVGSDRIDLELFAHTRVGEHLPQDAFGHGRTTDVGGADEEDGAHQILPLPWERAGERVKRPSALPPEEQRTASLPQPCYPTLSTGS